MNPLKRGFIVNFLQFLDVTHISTMNGDETYREWLNLQDLKFEGPENFKARNLKDWILTDQIVRVDFDGFGFWRTISQEWILTDRECDRPN